MNYAEFDDLFASDNDLYDAYMEYIMTNPDGDYPICNGDMLIQAAEDLYLFEEFRDYYIERAERDWEQDADRHFFEINA